jgi:membrane protein DedA with SNARE-associated domain
LDPLTGQLLEQLETYGSWLLFALTFLETAFLWGLVVPAGVATSVGTVLALAGTLALPQVVGAALAGGALGDSAGYWIGRATGERVLAGRGPWARAVRRHQDDLGRFFGRHPAYSVGVARLVSFVRTVMPMAAGMTGIRYPRFLAYELLGLAGCVTLYVFIGILAEESWQVATQLVGLGGAVAFAIAGAFLWMAFRRRHRHRRGHPGGAA